MNSKIEELLIPLGEVEIGEDFIVLHNYPFVPSSAFPTRRFEAEEIRDLSLLSAPPNMRVGNELLMLTAENGEELRAFAQRNKLPVVNRAQIWEAILEPFLDTEFTPEHVRKTHQYFEKYGLGVSEVKALRAEVASQMITYNFDTMLWEWVNLDLSDVLRAMRVKYNPAEFEAFYQKAMKLALLEEQKKEGSA